MILFNLNEMNKKKLRKIDDIHFVEFNMKIGAEKKKKTESIFIYLYLIQKMKSSSASIGLSSSSS